VRQKRLTAVRLLWRLRGPRLARGPINVASFDLTLDGQIKLVEPPLEPITDAYRKAKP
jgi:hypothetical protein